MLYIVANFKSHKTEEEASEWLDEFKDYDVSPEKRVILCPPFTLLEFFSQYIRNNSLNYLLGAQNVSQFGEGAYTGEENALQIKEFADYVLIGHSERRNLLHETEEVIREKTINSLTYGLEPLYFIQDAVEEIPNGVKLVVYEPSSAISGQSGGVPESVDDVLAIARQINDENKYIFLYGGSVSGENVKNFTSHKEIQGVVVGRESLSASAFAKIVQNA